MLLFAILFFEIMLTRLMKVFIIVKNKKRKEKTVKLILFILIFIATKMIIIEILSIKILKK